LHIGAMHAGRYTEAMDAQDSPPHPGQVCASCQHWRPEKPGMKTLGWGQCRRLPPAMPAIQDDKLVHVGVWPHTQESDWCGAWQSRASASGP
jgi:hypothetical protein